MTAIKAGHALGYSGSDYGNLLTPTPRHAPSLYSNQTGPIPRHDNDLADFKSIQILPTIDEILARDKPVYMPKRNLQSDNPNPTGPRRLLDLSFRQLRFESVELVKDICYSAAQNAYLPSPLRSNPREDQQLTSASSSPPLVNGVGRLEPKHETTLGHRYFLYNNVRVEELHPHESESVLVRLSFNCPPFMRGLKIHHTGRFEEGMLVALLCLNTSTSRLEIHYLKIHKLQSTKSMSMRGGHGRKAAVQLCFLPETPESTVQQFARFAQKACPEIEMALVELPKLLFAGFFNPLSRLQKLNSFAFSNIIAPSKTFLTLGMTAYYRRTNGRASIQPCSPPDYVNENGFEFHLGPIAKPGTAVEVTSYTLAEMEDPSSTAMIQSMTSLDRGQAEALRHSLRTRLAFTQGPPGTGKSYLGIALTRVLLASRPPTSSKPMLVVCLTNHALDNFLGGLEEAGVTNLLRFGNGSKEEWTSAINIHGKRSKYRYSQNESSQLSSLRKQASAVLGDIDSWCRGQSSQELDGGVKWYAIETFLYRQHRNIYDQFKDTSSTPALIALLFDFWVKGGDIQHQTELRAAISRRLKDHVKETTTVIHDVEEIMNAMTSTAIEQDKRLGSNSIWNIAGDKRASLLREWASNVDPSALAAQLARWYGEHRFIRAEAKPTKDDRDVRIMHQSNVIGMTTTACASNWDLLNALDLKIVVCEEAGKVLEPHVLCCLLPTVEHAIFIGDPEQLRPEVSEQSMSLDCNPHYRLDESLFEKLVLPRDPAMPALPMARLNVQRRMHPSISELSRVTYPFLEDYPSTMLHEPTLGLQERMFWWDHSVPELAAGDVTRSHANQHEVDMVAGLVQYLLSGGAYSQGNITVLTPYSGQLALLHTYLKRTCKVWLSDKDRENLLRLELLEVEEGPRTKDDVTVSDMLRISTIDNFQGEEAKVVILSTVRSGGGPGFMAIPNRINVACSRARNGFYIIGNSHTLRQVPMWQQIIQIFGNRRGEGLMTNCPNHSSHHFRVTDPHQFGNIPSCPIECTTTLPCGHICPEKCHPDQLHQENLIPCTKACEEPLSCGHKCPNQCGQKCGSCLVVTADARLPECNHWGRRYCSGKYSKCDVNLGTVQLECGHSINVTCGEMADDLSCTLPCMAMLECGHPCPGLCGLCKQRSGHSKCTRICGQPLKCGHLCQNECGHEGECQSCEKTIRVACEHGMRSKLCSQPSDLCLKPQGSKSDASQSSETPCCLPTLDLPSSTICRRQIGCGHECMSLNSEACILPTKCVRCRREDETKTFISIAECGHMVDVVSLDKLNLKNVYTIDRFSRITGFGAGPLTDKNPAKCTCGTLCPSVRRYRDIQKLVNLPETIGTFMGLAYEQLGIFAFHIEAMEKQFDLDRKIFEGELRSGPMSNSSNNRLLMLRKDVSQDIIDKIAFYRGMFFP